MIPAFPKPSQIKQKRKYLCDDGVFRYPNGREVCDLNSKKGRDEYKRRIKVAWEDQKHICPWCAKPLRWSEATMDHTAPRGMGGGARDDRPENIKAVHGLCNSLKGSRRVSYLVDAP